MNYIINIGYSMDLNGNVNPKQIINITDQEFILLTRFANVKKDKDLNDIYIINDIEFTITPNLDFL